MSRLFILVILLLATIGQFSSDIYIPSLPTMAHDFGVNLSKVQMSIFTFTIGFSVGAFIWGTLSDKYGRKIILLSGLGLGIAGSILCSIAWSINVLLIGRLIQGIGLSVAGVTRAVMRDMISDTRELAKLGSILGILYGLLVAFAPVIGGYIERYAFWRLSFILLTIYSISLLSFCIFKLPETNKKLQAIKMHQILGIYREVITNKVFMMYTVMSGFALGGIIAYATISPYLLEVKLGMAPDVFGWTTLFTCAALMIGGFLNVKMVMHRGINHMLKIGVIIFIISGLTLVMCGLFNFINVWSILIPVALFFLGCGFVFANANAGALTLFSDKAGTAGAVYACMQMAGGALSSLLISSVKPNQIYLGAIYLIFGTISLWFIKRLQHSVFMSNSII
jgi:Bcr/CflA subfamily drug resistance transporter